MTTQDNKIALRRLVELLNSPAEALARELIAPSAIFYLPGKTEPLRGPIGYLTIILTLREGFPDIHWTLEELVAEDDRVAARFTIRGTHTGTFFGVSPTNRKMQVEQAGFYTFSRGQIIEERGQPDILGIIHQITPVPGVPQA